MRGDVGPPLGAFVDYRADLVLAILVHPDRIGRRCDAAGAHDLDAVRALPQLVARRRDAGIDAIGDAARPVDDAARAQLVVMRSLLQRAKVAVPAGHRQHLAGVEEARRAHQSIRNRLGERVVAPADVAHGGEAAVERMPEHPDCMRGAVWLVDRFDLLHRYVAAVRVHMRIDQARHQRAPFEVDDACVWHAGQPCVSDRDKAAVPDRYAPDDRIAGVHGVDPAVHQA